MKKKAIAAGHICIDITPVFPETGARARNIGELLRPGTLLQTMAPDIHSGGSVANTGLGMKLMGADVSLLGKVGDDEFGLIIRSVLDKYGAGGGLITAPGETTSYSVVIAPPGIDRIFLHCPGANDTFNGTEITDEMLSDAALFHFGYPTLMAKMYENGGKAMEAMFRRLAGMGIATSLDLAAVDPDSATGRTDWRAILERTLPYVDFFVPSFEEICFLIDRPRYEKLKEKAGSDDMTLVLSLEEDIIPVAEQCLALGAKSVLLKCGAPGLYLAVSDRMDSAGKRLELDAAAWNGFGRFEKSYKVENFRSGTGAGDVCIAAFLTSILSGEGPERALQNAAAGGALACTSYDAISGIKPLEEIRRMIDSGWEKA